MYGTREKIVNKLWSEKCKMLCYVNLDILVTMVTKWTW